MDKKLSVPAGLHKQGAAFFRDVHNSYELDPRDAPILLETCRVLDEIEALKAVLEADGVTTLGSQGQVREHPALAGLRAHRATLDRLLVRLALPAEDGSVPLTVSQIRAQTGARARWAGHRRESPVRGKAGSA